MSVCIQIKVLTVTCMYMYVGHEVVRLPVAHCELNPIEMAWAQVKDYIKANNRRYV